MALNKYMHSRNIYKKPPDFAKLAKTFPEFSNIAKADVTGKVTINFSDPQALRILTKCLLKADFNLDVEIPSDRLVPTLPLRLNYILWIEDLLNAINRTDGVLGVDIGTGACAVYPLLAATMNKWHMIGTESDDHNIKKAMENIKRNNLQELIKLKHNRSSSVIEHIFTGEDDNCTYDFCMCNPPFYSSVQELCESRSPARPPPKNAFTGSPQELITEGGELEFCRKLIAESKAHSFRIRIFTTMVGHKYNFKELAQDLKTEGIKHTKTEFCQGRVTRWGLAWTFLELDIYNLVPPRNQLRKKTSPITYVLPELPNMTHELNNICNKLKSMLDGLNIVTKVMNKRGNQITYDMVAKENTWSNQRRKRRMMRRQEEKSKRVKLDVATDTVGSTVSHEINKEKCEPRQNNNTCDLSKSEFDKDKTSLTTSVMEATVTVLGADQAIIKENIIMNDQEKHDSSLDRGCGSIDLNKTENSKIYIEKIAAAEPLVHAILKVFKRDNMFVEFEFINGKGGKEVLHQIVQYIKNNWK